MRTGSATGPSSAASTISAEPPGMSTRTSRPTRPQRWARWAAAVAPVPQASVTPAPRSHTRRSRVSGPSPAVMNSTFTPFGHGRGDVGTVADGAHGDVDLGHAMLGVVVDHELPPSAVGDHEVGRLVV